MKKRTGQLRPNYSDQPPDLDLDLKIYVHHVVWKGSLPIRKAIVELL